MNPRIGASAHAARFNNRNGLLGNEWSGPFGPDPQRTASSVRRTNQNP